MLRKMGKIEPDIKRVLEIGMGKYLREIEPRICKGCFCEDFCESYLNGEICLSQVIMRRLLSAKKLAPRDVEDALKAQLMEENE